MLRCVCKRDNTPAAQVGRDPGALLLLLVLKDILRNEIGARRALDASGVASQSCVGTGLMQRDYEPTLQVKVDVKQNSGQVHAAFVWALRPPNSVRKDTALRTSLVSVGFLSKDRCIQQASFLSSTLQIKRRCTIEPTQERSARRIQCETDPCEGTTRNATHVCSVNLA